MDYGYRFLVLPLPLGFLDLPDDFSASSWIVTSAVALPARWMASATSMERLW